MYSAVCSNVELARWTWKESFVSQAIVGSKSRSAVCSFLIPVAAANAVLGLHWHEIWVEILAYACKFSISNESALQLEAFLFVILLVVGKESKSFTL